MPQTTWVTERDSEYGLNSGYAPIKIAYFSVVPDQGLNESLCPIIILHGFMETKEIWHNIAQIICNETKRKVYVYDLRNHGDTEWTEDFTLNLLADDLNYFMDSNNIPKAILIGFSMGGYAACRLALMRPEKVELVIAEETSVGKYPTRAGKVTGKLLRLWVDAVRQVPSDMNMKEAIKFAVNYIYDKIPTEKQGQLSDKKVLYECNYAFKLTDSGYELKMNIPMFFKTLDNFEYMSTPAEGVFDGPAFFMYGGSSALNIKNDAEIKQHFPNAEVIIIDGATHSIHIDQPEKYLDTILSFILKHGKSKY